jgi:hypothetical protein
MRLKGYPASNRDRTRLNGRLRLDREEGGRRAMATDRAHRSSPSGALELSSLGVRAQNGAEGKGILTRGSLAAGWVPGRLTAAGTLLLSFGSVQGNSKASSVLKLNVGQRCDLLKLVETFNCGNNRWKIDL